MVWGMHHDPGFFTHPFYQPGSFQPSAILAGTSVAVLSYIGFDAVSTLSEEVENPRRNIMMATVLVCLITGVLSGVEVYAAQLVWGSKPFPSDQVESAFALLSRQVGGVILFQLINFTLLAANVGSGMGAQLAAGRLLYGMGRGNALPSEDSSAQSSRSAMFRATILCWWARWRWPGRRMLEFFASRLGGGAYEIGAQALNFGALISFMGVNAASFVLQWRSGSARSVFGLAVPVLGFLVCGLLWVNLSRPAFLAGTCWLAAGLAYGAVRTRGFRAELVHFEDVSAGDSADGDTAPAERPA